jgi:hypothetical protein
MLVSARESVKDSDDLLWRIADTVDPLCGLAGATVSRGQVRGHQLFLVADGS